MAQLYMIWRPTNGGSTEYTLRDGFEVRAMKYGEITEWCETSVELTGRQWSDEEFISKMLFNSPLTLSPRNIYCAFDLSGGKMAATAAACLDGVNGKGDLHMVTTRADYKGLGLGKAVCAEAVKCFTANKCVEAELSTDDFRKPAIAIYLKLGFRPWLYLDDMQPRWTTVLKEMAWQREVLAYDKDKNDVFLYRQ